MLKMRRLKDGQVGWFLFWIDYGTNMCKGPIVNMSLAIAMSDRGLEGLDTGHNSIDFLQLFIKYMDEYIGMVNTDDECNHATHIV